MTVRVEVLQELPAAVEGSTPDGCCALGSIFTCPSNTFDAVRAGTATP
jgi:hypothetical protein